MQHRADVDVAQLWDDFHSCVNINSEKFRIWLMTEGSNEEGFPDNSALNMSARGRSILGILGKRRTDLTNDDLEVMITTVEDIRALLDRRPAAGASDDRWRRALMDLGHDPLQEK